MDFLEKIRLELHVIKSAPFAFVIFLVAGATVGYVASSWYYSKQITDKDGQIFDRDGQISRYQVVLGIKPGSAGALVELNNEELALKAQAIVTQLRELGSVMDVRLADIQKQVVAGKIDQKQAFQDSMAARQEISQEFDNNLASDAHNIDDELRKRLNPATLSHVVRVPAIVGVDGTRVPITALFKDSGIGLEVLKGI